MNRTHAMLAAMLTLALHGTVENDAATAQAADGDGAAALAARERVGASVKVENGRAIFETTDGFRSPAVYIHAGAQHYRQLAGCGVHLLATSFCPLPVGQPVDREDVRRRILAVLAQDPKAYVILHVTCNPTDAWRQAHPEEIWKNDGTPSRSKTKPDNPSYGSAAYVNDVAYTLKDLGEYLRTAEEGKVVVALKYSGGNDGQFFGGWMGQLDHSEGHRRGYQQWLREQYKGDVNALRRAWDDPAATFENARVPLENERGKTPYLSHQGRDRWVMDAQEYDSTIVSTMLKTWTRAFKAAIGKPVFTMGWGPDAIHGQGHNIYRVSERLSGAGKMDSQTGVNLYQGWREPGEVGSILLTWGSFLLRGSAPLCELDYRPAGLKPYGPDTPAEFRAQIRRDVAAAASKGMCHWFYEMGGERGWYVDDNTLPALAEGVRIQEWAHRPAAPSPTAEMCVFVDEDSGWRRGTDQGSVWNAHRGSTKQLCRAGVPYDAYYLDDIRRDDLPDYKVYILQLGATITKEQVAALRAKCHRPGKTLLVLTNRLGEGSPDYRGKTEELQAALRGDQGKTLFFAEMPPFTDLHRIAREAGVNAYASPGQATYFGSGVAACHRLTDGEVAVHFGRPVDLISTDGQERVLAENVTEWRPRCARLETDLVFYRVRD